MYPLIPDDFSFRALADDRLICEHRFPDLAGPHADAVVRQIQMSDLFSSFGTSYPRAIALHNYPRSLQQFQRPDGVLMDLAPQTFCVHANWVSRAPTTSAGSFEELVEDPVWAQELRRVYDHDLERIDLIVGMFAEKRPPGFAFSETAFRIFALMVLCRLNSDRFFTTDYRPEIYTQLGLEWIRDTTFSALLLRQYPYLQACLQGVTHAFTPWTKATPARGALEGASAQSAPALPA